MGGRIQPDAGRGGLRAAARRRNGLVYVDVAGIRVRAADQFECRHEGSPVMR